MIGEKPNEITWWKVADFLQYCRSHPVPAALRILLTSDGTVVGTLRALWLEPVTLERVDQREVILEGDRAVFFRQPDGTKGLSREIYLVQNGRRSVHAFSFFPLHGLSPRFYQEIVQTQIPMGSLIETHALMARRDGIEICRVSDAPTARELGCPEDAPLWGRRYQLVIPGEASASIFEVFSSIIRD